MTSMTKLNKKQKQFLFDNYYVTAKVLDAATLPGWQNYFINEFDWTLEGKDQYGFEKLYLKDKGTDDIEYRVGLIFQNDDYAKLISTKSKTK